MSKVMLADHTLDGGDSECLAKLTFPKLILPKYDGIRVHTSGGKLYSKTSKLIPNVWLQKQLSGLISGLEGEVVVNGNFADTTSCLRSHDKTDFDFKYFLFDSSLSVGNYNDRYMFLVDSCFVTNINRVTVSEVQRVDSLKELLKLEDYYTSIGMEGVIIRDPNSAYKNGRATFKEQSYLSIKRHMTDTARIIGYKCKLEGGVPVDTLGALELDFNGVTFHCGSGLDDDTRSSLWAKQDELIGKSVEFKYQKSEQIAPRFPVFLRLV